MDQPPTPPVPEIEPAVRGARRRTVLWLVIGVFFVAMAGALWRMATTGDAVGLKGGLKIDAPPGAQVYVGERLVGVGPVQLSWKELLRSDEGQPFVIDLTEAAPAGHTHFESFSGQGAQILWSLIGMSASMGGKLSFVREDVLIRRADGVLDNVQLLDCTIKQGSWRRFLVPIRVRFADKEGAAPSFHTPGGGGIHGGGLPLPGMQRIWLHTQIKLAPVPAEFQQEVAERGLWAPAR